MKNLVRFFPAIVAICLFPACTEDDDKTVGPVPPNHATIVFEAPAADTVITGGQELPIIGTISSLKGIQGYQVIVRRKSDNAELMVQNFSDTDTMVGFHQAWTNNLTTAADMEVEVIANLDQSGNTASEKVMFQATP